MPIEAEPGLAAGKHDFVRITIDDTWLSPERFAEYLEATSGARERASRLYEWNALDSSALFEFIGHVEVLLRNAIIYEVERAGSTPRRSSGCARSIARRPWQKSGRCQSPATRSGIWW